jgi:hypothetical protein
MINKIKKKTWLTLLFISTFLTSSTYLLTSTQSRISTAPQEIKDRISITSPVSFVPPITNRSFWNSQAHKIPKRAFRSSDFQQPTKDRVFNPLANQRNLLAEGTLQICIYEDRDWERAVLKTLAHVARVPWRSVYNDPTENLMTHANAGLAAEVATTLYLLGPKVPPKLYETLRKKINEEAITPLKKSLEEQNKSYLAREGIHARHPFAWLDQQTTPKIAILTHLLITSLALNSSQENQALIQACLPHLEDYLEIYGDDGNLPAGIAAWTVSTRNYTLLAEILLKASGGELNLFQHPALPKVVGYPFSAQINPPSAVLKTAAYPNIGNNPNSPISLERFAWTQKILQERFSGLPELRSAEEPQEADAQTLLSKEDPLLRLLSLNPPRPPEEKIPAQIQTNPLRSYFPSTGLLISRSPKHNITLVAQAGKNHGAGHYEGNHLDVGSYSLFQGGYAIAGETGDPGKGEISPSAICHGCQSRPLGLDTFASAYAHPVPTVNYQMQTTDSLGEVIQTDFTNEKDTLTLDLKRAYPKAPLKSLTRTLTFQRDPPTLTVKDTFEATEPIYFETGVINHLGKNQMKSLESYGSFPLRTKKQPLNESFERISLSSPNPQTSGWVLQILRPKTSETSETP